VVTLLATGTPMLLMGDEIRRSQGGNNNAYCQNNEVSWLDWTLAEKHADVYRFVKALIALRTNRELPVDRLDMTLNELLRRQPIQWHGVKLNAPDWSHQSHALAATVPLLGYKLLLHLIMNAYWETLEFEIPPYEGQEAWRRCVDTCLDPPNGIRSWQDAQILRSSIYLVQPRSVVILLGRAGPEGAS